MHEDSDVQIVHITHSLFLALKDIRALYCKDQEQSLWADSVCICQSNFEERAQQVSIMNVIYQHARRVLTYTGPETANSIQAVDFIQILGEQAKEWKGKRADMSFPSEEDPRWTALHEFFQRPWPSRVWIVQESLLSQSPPILLCGRREVCWDLVVELVLLAHDGHFPFVIRHIDTDSASSLLWLGELRAAIANSSTRKDMNLVDLLRACRARRCADARDKIFAVLSLASDTGQLRIRADYNLSKQELFTKVAANIMQQTQSLEILESVAHEKQSNLPSWVPDWTTDRVTVSLDLDYSLSPENGAYMFSAGGQEECFPTIDVDANSGVLSFQGTIIDRISLLTDVVCAKKKTNDRSWMAWLQETIKAFDTSVYGQEEVMEMAFWHTLSGGRTHDRQKVSEDYQPQFSAWRDHITTGDEICVVRGSRVPWILRESEGFRIFIGECYIHGIMDGEALKFPGFQPQEVRVI